ncbi:MAG: hypothetical protein WAM95_11790, partial [Bacillus sp. (in: firmicutes)]
TSISGGFLHPSLMVRETYHAQERHILWLRLTWTSIVRRIFTGSYLPLLFFAYLESFVKSFTAR